MARHIQLKIGSSSSIPRSGKMEWQGTAFVSDMKQRFEN
jgi:hypothetical protein